MLKKLGYDITEVKPDLIYAKPIGKELFFCLPRIKFQSALIILGEEIVSLESNFKIEYQFDII